MLGCFLTFSQCNSFVTCIGSMVFSLLLFDKFKRQTREIKNHSENKINYWLSHLLFHRRTKFKTNHFLVSSLGFSGLNDATSCVCWIIVSWLGFSLFFSMQISTATGKPSSPNRSHTSSPSRRRSRSFFANYRFWVFLQQDFLQAMGHPPRRGGGRSNSESACGLSSATSTSTPPQ